ncbi:MAG TPA: APC family permease [Verrucomicrobiae bacterium]|nr:APC family permease [Verrucomicrobiae bacterium]
MDAPSQSKPGLSIGPSSHMESQRLKRVLTLRDLLVYGMMIMQVVAPVPIFGLLEQRSNNHSVTTILAAMVVMAITAISYGRMARLYPMAGSAYTYVGRALNPHLGFLAGWSMFLDYLIIPLISAIIPALAIQRLVPSAPLPLLTFFIVAGMTALNLKGIRTTVRANMLLLAITSLAVVAFLVLAVHYLFLKAGWAGVFSTAPLYSPESFQPRALLAGISLAAMNYIGFDGLTTLAEDSVNPKRDMVLATVLVVVITGILSAVELYFLHLVLPDWRLADPNSSYLDVMRMVGGPVLFTTFLVVMSVSQFGSGFNVQVNAARLLYGMGRDNVLPKPLFGYLSPKRQNPSRNIILVGVLAYLGTVFISFDHACDLLNFGAFVGFMGVNLATVWSYYLRPPKSHQRHLVWDALLPSVGFLMCLVFWIGLPGRAKIVGGVWLLAGVLYSAWKTRGFRDRPLLFDFRET